MKLMYLNALTFLGLCINILSGSATAAEPKLSVLFVVDTNAKEVGGDTGPGCVASMDQIKKVLRETFVGKEERYDIYTLDGESIDKGTVMQHIRDIKTESDDTFWFYYCGHGAYDNKTGEYLATSQGDIANSEIRTAIENKGVRLTVITTEKCSSPGDFVYQQPRPTPAVWEVFNQLFFQHRGVTEFTAATTPQFGWINSLRGGFMTQAMSSVFCDQISNVDNNDDGFVSWAEAFVNIRSRTEKLFLDARSNELKRDPEAKIGEASGQTPNAYAFADIDRPEDGPVRFHKELRITNNTDETLCVWVRCYAYSNGEWSWLPSTTTSWRYEIEPGDTTFLNPGEAGGSLERVAGHRFEIWGNSLSGTKTFSKENVEATTTSGYRAPKDATYNYNMWLRERGLSDVSSSTTYDVFRNGKKGMLIRLEFTTHFLKLDEVRFNALFFRKDGSELKDTDGAYTTANGQVGVATKFKPIYLHSKFSMDQEDSVELFLPYEELHHDTDQGKLEAYFELHADVGGESVFTSATQNHFQYGSSD